MKMYPLLKHHAMRKYWRVEVSLHAILNLGNRWNPKNRSLIEGYFTYGISM
jgi:hypothetical protein